MKKQLINRLKRGSKTSRELLMARRLWLVVAASILLLAPLLGQTPQNHPYPVGAIANVSLLTVPDVRGQVPAQAQIVLRERGLAPRNTTPINGQGAVGTICRQVPSPGSRVPHGTPIDLYVVAASEGTSDGDGEFQARVPNLSKDTLSQATTAIQGSGLRLGTVSWGSGKGTAQTVMAQNPQAGAWVRGGGTVDITLISPPKTVSPDLRTVPLLSGQTAKAAAHLLNNNELRLGAVSTGNAKFPAGEIYSQQPPPGSSVIAGTPVNIWVAQGQPITTAVVPNVIHDTSNQARAVLVQARLQLGAVQTDENDNLAGLIVSQSPPPGTRIPPGSAVNVTIAIHTTVVTVPDIRHEDESSAISSLESAGLRMGNIGQQDSDEVSGTILAQNPLPLTQVRKGTVVNATVSHQIIHTLRLLPETPNPEIGKPVRIHAHLVPSGSQYQYQFRFGQGAWSQWQSNSVTIYTFRAAGPREVDAVAALNGTTVATATDTITAQEAAYTVALGMSTTTPGKDQAVEFTAATNRRDVKPLYQFVFADGTTTNWQPQTKASHAYKSRGNFAALVRARVEDGGVVESKPQKIYVGIFSLLFWGGVIGTVLVASTVAGSKVYGYQQFIRLVRTNVGTDRGRQWIVLDGRKGNEQSVQVRVVHPEGTTKIVRIPERKMRRVGGA